MEFYERGYALAESPPGSGEERWAASCSNDALLYQEIKWNSRIKGKLE